MSKPTRSKRKADDSEDTSYRGSHIFTATRPLSMSAIKEVCLNSRDPLQAGALDYFKERAKEDNFIRTIKPSSLPEGYSLVMITIAQGLPLDVLINQPKHNGFIEDTGFSKYLKENEHGILIGGRDKDGIEYYSLKDLSDDLEGSVNGIKEILSEHNEEMEDFSSTLLANDIEVKDNIMSTIDELIKTPDGRNKFGRIFAEYSFGNSARRQLPRVTGSECVDIDKIVEQSRDYLNLDFFRDIGITRYAKDPLKGYKFQWALYALENKLVYADPFSSNGSTIIMKNRKKEDVLADLNAHLKCDEKDKYLVREKGTLPVEQSIEIKPTSLAVSLLRDNEKNSKNSQVNHVTIIDSMADFGEKDQTVISMGEIDPITNRQSSSLIILPDKKRK